MHPFQKLLEKKMKMGDMLSPDEKNAHKSALLGLKKDADGTIADKLKGLQKVTVASTDDSGLEEGLSKAKDLLGAHELGEGAEEEAMEHSPSNPEMNLEDIDDKIAELLKMREACKNKTSF